MGLINSKEKNLRHQRNLRDQTPAQIGLQEKKIPKDYLLCLSLQKKCHVLKIGSQRASAGKYLTKCIFLHIFRKYFFAMPCCVKCPYLVKCCPKLPPFSISANNNFPRFSSIGAIIFSSDSPNASCSTYITAPANFHNPRCFNSQVYLGGPIPYNLARPLMVRQPYSAAVPSDEEEWFPPSPLRVSVPYKGNRRGRKDLKKTEMSFFCYLQ